MKQIIFMISLVTFLSCSDNKKEAGGGKDSTVSLRTDTVNVVKLTDTLVIHESTCRGCAYEQSTHFDISDSIGIIKLLTIITTDNNAADMNGGSISKDLILVPTKTGATTLKLYKFWKDETTPEDSAKFIPYIIEVQN